MVTERGRKRLPPYISYRLFRNFLERLQQGIPARIDRSYWEREGLLSGSSGTQLMAALRYLNLIDENGRPADRLKPLVLARGEQRAALLREITRECFSFALQGALDPHSATYSQLEEIFNEKFQLNGQLSRKCLKFFCEISSDSGVPLSPFITKRFHSGHVTDKADVITKKTITRTRSVTKRVAPKANQNSKVQFAQDDPPPMESMDKLLLSKFPTFDPSWGDEMKLKWFSAFDELMRRILAKDEK
jgi:hypothetical protein